MRDDEKGDGDSRANVARQLLSPVILGEPEEAGKQARGRVPGRLARALPPEAPGKQVSDSWRLGSDTAAPRT